MVKKKRNKLIVTMILGCMLFPTTVYAANYLSSGVSLIGSDKHYGWAQCDHRVVKVQLIKGRESKESSGYQYAETGTISGSSTPKVIAKLL